MNNTTENNKLIAEFMGIQPHRLEAHFNSITTANNDYIEKPSYNTSWDWLMPVLHKVIGIIRDLPDSSEKYDWETGWSDNVEGLYMNDLYIFAIEFIKWYNENKND